LEEHGRMQLGEHWDEFARRLRFVVSSADDGSGDEEEEHECRSSTAAVGRRWQHGRLGGAERRRLPRVSGLPG